MRTFSLLILLAALAALAFSCSDKAAGTGSASAVDAPSTWEEVKSYTSERSQEFSSYLTLQLTALDGRLEALAARGDSQWQASRAGIEEKRAALAEQMQKLGEATGPAWTEAKNRAVELYEDLQDSLRGVSADPEK